MIELRVVQWPNGREVLQYRHWLAYTAANGNAMFPIQPEWSEWKDAQIAAAPLPNKEPQP